MRNLMKPIQVGNRIIKFAFDKDGNEYGFYADDEALDTVTSEGEEKVAKEHMAATIDKLVKCGKALPQKDRIRCSKNPEEETVKVLSETIQLWWEIFSKQDIDVRAWEKATDKALILNGIPRLDTSMVSPTLMQAAIQECQKEHLYEQQSRSEQIKRDDREGVKVADFPEIGRLIRYHIAKHKRPLLQLQPAEKIREWGIKGRWHEETVDKNLIQLRVWYLFCQHAKRDGEPNPIRMTLNGQGHVVFEFVS